MRVLLRAIRSRAGHPNLKQALEEVKDAIDSEVKENVIEDFEAQVLEWRHQPDFTAKKFVGGDEIRLEVTPTGPNAKIFIYNDLGTKPHIIRPRNRSVLRFHVDGEEVFSKIVHHPGTKPKRITEGVRKRQQAAFRRIVENALRRGIGR